MSDLGNEKPFNVIDEFNGWRKQSDFAEAVAATRAAVIRGSEASDTLNVNFTVEKIWSLSSIYSMVMAKDNLCVLFRFCY